jgi:hypothetical protein
VPPPEWQGDYASADCPANEAALDYEKTLAVRLWEKLIGKYILLVIEKGEREVQKITAQRVQSGEYLQRAGEGRRNLWKEMASSDGSTCLRLMI